MPECYIERLMENVDTHVVYVVTVHPPSSMIQSRLDECQATVTSLQAQLHSSTSEARRQQEHLRDKAAGKVWHTQTHHFHLYTHSLIL